MALYRVVDRLAFAAELCHGKKVLDIGGQKMPNCDPKSPFAREYRKIQQTASEYRIVDYQQVPGVDYLVDLNRPDGVESLRKAIEEYRPQVVLCMETLEHVNYHFESMNAMAHAIGAYGATVFITVPNNGNWVFNALGWNSDHSIAFFQNIADRFVRRSELGLHKVEIVGCMQKYVWYWWIAYTISFFQPFSWGFVVKPVADRS
jgi:hypothetical protein